MNDLGYVPYLGFIFLPGIGLGEVLGVWRENDSFVARVAYALGVGLPSIPLSSWFVLLASSQLSRAWTFGRSVV